jgi:hypothetical protein
MIITVTDGTNTVSVPVGIGPLFATIDSERGQFATEIAMATSINAAGVVNSFIHGYSGASHPATFSVSAVSTASHWNSAAMLNTKLDWAGLANGSYDSLIAVFYESWPQAVKGWVTVNHEPENDAGDPEVWCAGVSRYVQVAAAVVRERRLNVAVGGVLMAFSWTTPRWQAYQWWKQIPPRDRPQTFFGLDLYGKCLPTVPVTGEDIVAPLKAIIAPVREAGINRFALFETALDRRQKNKASAIIGTDATIAAWLPKFARDVASIPGMEAVCHFHAAAGPASQYAQLLGPSIPVWAAICRDGCR